MNSASNKESLPPGNRGIIKSRGDLVVVLALGGVLILGIIFWMVKPALVEPITFDFSQADTVVQWRISGSESVLLSPVGLKVEVSDSCLLMSPPPGKAGSVKEGMVWADYSQVVIRFSPQPAARPVALVWNPDRGTRGAHKVDLTLPAMTDRLELNTQSLPRDNMHMVWSGPISQYGLQFSDDIEIRSIALHPISSPIRRLQFLMGEYAVAEPFWLSAINGLQGIEISGLPLVFLLGLLVAWCALLTLIHVSKFSVRLLIMCGLLAFILFDLQFTISLLDHLRLSSRHSSWHFSREDELESRFGKDFAHLAEVLYEKVPAGSQVLFPQEKTHCVRGAPRWISFQSYPRYRAVSLQEAEYILYYYPRDYAFDSSCNEVRHLREEEMSVPVELVYESSENMKIFRVRHD